MESPWPRGPSTNTGTRHPGKARKSGLRLIQQDVLDQWNAVFGDQRNFAETVNAYIEKKLEAE
jgi:hypothetical protein